VRPALPCAALRLAHFNAQAAPAPAQGSGDWRAHVPQARVHPHQGRTPAAVCDLRVQGLGREGAASYTAATCHFL